MRNKVTRCLKLLLLIILLLCNSAGCTMDGTCRVVERHPNGAKKLERCQVVERNGKRKNYTSFYPNGEIESTYSLLNGKFDGVASWFFENGKLSEISTYENGILKGPHRVYSESGELHELNLYFSDSLIFTRRFVSADLKKEIVSPVVILEKGQTPLLKIYFPVDSNVISRDRELFYCFGQTDPSRHLDSIIIKNECLNRVQLDFSIEQKIELDNLNQNMKFYGYVLDEKNKHIYEPRIFSYPAQ